MGQRIGERQRWAWLLAGESALVATCACGMDWIWIVAAAAIVSGYYIYIERYLGSAGLSAIICAKFGKAGKGILLLTLVWLVVLAAWSANLADAAYPMVDGYPVLGWTVLAMAAWGSWKGAAVCAGCVGVLCLFLLGLYGTVSAFAVPDITLAYLIPQGQWKSLGLVMGLLLVPAAIWYLPCKRTREELPWKTALLLPVGAGLLGAVTVGVLSPALARSLASPLYTVAQSVSVFGVVERIEPLLSAAMTMGAFCLLAVLACAAGRLSQNIWDVKWGGPICCLAAGIGMKWIGKINLQWITVGNIVFYVAIPICTMKIKAGKKNGSSNGG